MEAEFPLQSHRDLLPFRAEHAAGEKTRVADQQVDTVILSNTTRAQHPSRGRVDKVIFLRRAAAK